MAYITLDCEKLKLNFEYLDSMFKENNIEWSVVSKLLSGNKLFLTELLKFNIKQICDSRIMNLRVIKTLNPKIETIFIKPPAHRTIPSVIKYADISINTEFETIKLLSEEAGRQHKIHKILIMIELGELREGVLGDDFMAFYESVFKLENIQVVGIGANLSCLYGVLPSQDKLIQLSLYEQLIEAKFNKQIPYVSGGTSVTIPLILKNLLPKSINHFRVGETLFLGTDVYNGTKLEKMHSDVFLLYSQIIELIEKPMNPTGTMGTNLEGESCKFDKANLGKTSFRAIIDLGLLDVGVNHLKLVDKTLSVAGASSDMIVIDLGENKKNYKVGDLIKFKMDYMGILRIINSKYIDKKLTNPCE